MSLAGGGRREHAGISSVNSDEKSGRRKPKVSWGRQIRPGLVGPKTRPKGVVDGQQVNIPVPLVWCLTEGGTQEDRPGHMMVVVQVSRLVRRQIRALSRLRHDGEGNCAEPG